MAMPITETPMLKGKDALKFLKQMQELQTKKPDEKKIAKMRENFTKLNSIPRF